MKITKPSYYTKFHCIAGACPDSCCKEWDVQVDADAAAYYRSLSGDLGDRLRQVLEDTEDGTVMVIENGRCPMWRQDGLCRIQAELGEDALCQVCRDFPRLRHDYGDFQEWGLELSCPEAAGLILADRTGELCTEEIPGGEPADYDEEAMEILLRSRKTALELLCGPESVPQRLVQLLMFGYQVQGELDGDEPAVFDPQLALEEAAGFAAPGDIQEIREFFRELEILTPEWHTLLSGDIAPGPWTEELAAMARYLVLRYWLQAVSDYDLVCRVKMAVILCLLVRLLGGNVERTAQLCSKEIENSADNVDAILDAAYSHPAFTDAKLLYWLLTN